MAKVDVIYGRHQINLSDLSWREEAMTKYHAEREAEREARFQAWQDAWDALGPEEQARRLKAESDAAAAEEAKYCPTCGHYRNDEDD